MRPPLPAELIDYIFSFLRGDIPALKACSGSHPSISQLAERHLFADVGFGELDCFMLQPSNKIFKNPRILQYIRTLKVFNTTSELLLSTIPQMVNLVSVTLCELRLDPANTSILRVCLQQPSVKRIFLSRFHIFPLSLLDEGKYIKKLTLLDCEPISEPKSKSPEQLPEELSIRGSLHINLLTWLTGRVANLKSLHLEMEQEHWISFRKLLSACSSSLTELHLSVSTNMIEDHNPWFPLARCSVRSWISKSQNLPFNLSQHKCLKRLSIFARVRSTKNGPLVGFDGALPAIKNLIETAPPIQNIVLRLHWVDPTPGSLGRFDYSLLSPNASRIHLSISADINGDSISPASILETLAENEGLMDLVKRDVVILKPRSTAPSPDDDSYS